VHRVRENNGNAYERYNKKSSVSRFGLPVRLEDDPAEKQDGNRHQAYTYVTYIDKHHVCDFGGKPNVHFQKIGYAPERGDTQQKQKRGTHLGAGAFPGNDHDHADAEQKRNMYHYIYNSSKHKQTSSHELLMNTPGIYSIVRILLNNKKYIIRVTRIKSMVNTTMS